MKTKANEPASWCRRGFTLIELMVVVTIIGLLAWAASVVLRSGSSSRMSSLKLMASEEQRYADKNYTSGGEAARSAIIMHSAVLNMALHTDYKRGDSEIFSRYTCECKGTLGFSLVAGRSDPLLIAVPFPEDVTEVRDVSLKLLRGSTPVTPDEMTFTAGGIFARCKAGGTGENDIVTAEIAFTATGQDRFEWQLPPAHERRGVSITIVQDGAKKFSVPDRSLQPTVRKGNTMTWEFKNVVTARPIVVELPAAASPLGRVSTLMRYLALAVMLFGAGFWYLSEHRQPGRMESFRLGHFLLLALTYSIFFVIFSVLEYREWPGTAWALVISAICSLPLLILHVSRIVDMDFALKRIVPLTLFIVLVVFGVVYLPEHFDFIGTGALVAILACLTITWKKWSTGRDEHRKVKLTNASAAASVETRTSRERLLRMTELESAVREAAALLGQEQRGDLAGPRARLESLHEEGARLAGEYRSLLKDGVKPTDVMHLFSDRVTAPLTDLREQIAAFRTAVADSRASTPHAAAEVHCTACGQPGPRSTYCQSCGELRALTNICKTCRTSLTIPLHLLPEPVSPATLHCPACGSRHT